MEMLGDYGSLLNKIIDYLLESTMMKTVQKALTSGSSSHLFLYRLVG